jgi:hypothetical protein
MKFVVLKLKIMVNVQNVHFFNHIYISSTASIQNLVKLVPGYLKISPGVLVMNSLQQTDGIN